MEEFEELLREYEIEIARGSHLERIMLNMTSFLDIHLGRAKPEQGKAYSKEFSEVLGLLDLAEQTLAAERRGKLAGFVPHLKLLNRGLVSQNVASLSIDQASHKLFELFIGLLCLQHSSRVELDHPDRSKGNNPDVLVTIDETVYGFACKTPSSPSLQTITDRIVDGVAQIKKSPADRGFVTINLKNLTDHGSFWPVYGEQEIAWTDIDAASKQLKRMIDEGASDLAAFNDGKLLDLFDDTPVAGLLFFANTAILRAPGPVPQLLGSFFFLPAKHVTQQDRDAIEPLNIALRWDSLV